jgi:hypothetical protein
MMFGYYHVLAQYGDFLNDVSAYTNTQIILQNSFLRSDGTNDITGFNNAFNRANASGDTIIFAPEFSPTTELNRGLDAARNFWSTIDYIYLADEPTWSRATTESNITAFRANITARGWTQKPIIINYTNNQIMTDTAWQASNLDIVSFEAYVDYSRQNETDLANSLTTQINASQARIRNATNKQMMIVVQGYGRNYCPPGQTTTLCWSNISSLKDIQTPVYLASYNESDVIGITIFSYGRSSGTKDLVDNHGGQCIKTEHQRIWGAISRTAQPAPVACTGGTSAPQFAPILSRWTPSTTNGWWPELSPDGRYVMYGNWGGMWITDLQADQTYDLGNPPGTTMDRCIAGKWIRPDTATYLCEDGAARYEVRVGEWISRRTSDPASVTASSIFDAKDGHWASYLAGNAHRITKDGTLLTNSTGGLGGLSNNLLAAACDNNNTSICIWNGATISNRYTSQFGFNDLRIGEGDYVAYGNTRNVRGICISDGREINLKAGLPSMNEGLIGIRSIFPVNGAPWVITGEWEPSYVLLRPWGERESIAVNIGAVYASVYYDAQNQIFKIAYNNATGGMAVITISANAPRSNLSGGLAPETCGTGGSGGGGEPTITPFPYAGPYITGIEPDPVVPGGILYISGTHLSGNITVFNTSGTRLGAYTGTMNGDVVEWTIPSSFVPESYYLQITTNGEVSNNGPFTVMGPPRIFSIDPTEAMTGDTVTILGENLPLNLRLTDLNGNIFNIDSGVNPDELPSQLSFVIGNNIPPGTYTISVSGANGSAVSSQTLTIVSNEESEVAPQALPPIPTANLPGGTMGEIIRNGLGWSMRIMGLIVFVMIIWGGVLWLTAAGNPGKIAQGKKKMTNAVFGAILLASSFLILNTINPDLVSGTFYLQGINPAPPLPSSSAMPIPRGIVSGDCHGVQCSGDTTNICGPVNPGDGCNMAAVNQYDAAIRRGVGSRRISGIDVVKLLKAIIANESDGNIDAVAADGQSVGLFQMTNETASIFRASCGVSSSVTINNAWMTNPANVDEQACMATEYLRSLVGMCGDSIRQLAAGYNGGVGACDVSRNCGPLSEQRCSMCQGQTEETRRWECLWDDDSHTICNIDRSCPGGARGCNFSHTRIYAPRVEYCYGQF